MPMLALITVMLLAVGALGTDVFLLYWNYHGLQDAVDAAALAGATYLGNVRFSGTNPSCSYATDAQNAACTFALANQMQSGEIQSIGVSAGGTEMTVTGRRIVPAVFARVLGFTHFTVTATATAGLRVLHSARNLAPIGLDFRTPYLYGQSIVMHAGNCGPGCWGALALPSQSGTVGGEAFRENLAQGCACTVKVDDSVAGEPGAKVGPVTQAIGERLNAGFSSDPGGTWDKHSSGDIRATTVALVDWDGCAGRCNVVVKGFAEVWITGSSESTINAIFIRQVASGEAGSGAISAGAFHATLLR